MKKMWIVMLLVLLVACSNKGEVLTFQAEGKDWKASYEVGEVNTTYTIVYIGKDKAPKTFDYTVAPIFGSSKTEATDSILNEDGFIQKTEQILGARIQKDESINIEINWNGKTENLLLTLK